MKKQLSILALLFLSGHVFGYTDDSLKIENSLTCPITVTVYGHDACIYSSPCSLTSNTFTVPASTTVTFVNINYLDYPGYAGAYWLGMVSTACSGGVSCMGTCGWDWANVSAGICTANIGNVSCGGTIVSTIGFTCCSDSFLNWTNASGNVTISFS